MTASETSKNSPAPFGRSRVPPPTVALLVGAFLLELAAFGALGYAGWRLGSGILRLLLMFTVPIVAIGVWGLFVAPKARVRLPAGVRLAVELVVYAAAVVGLLVAGAVVAGVVLGAFVVVFQVVRAVMRRRGMAVTA